MSLILLFNQGSTTNTKQYQNGISRIQLAGQAQTLAGLSRIGLISSQGQSGTARIQITSAQTQTGVVDVQATSSQNQTGHAFVNLRSLATQIGVSRIQIQSPQTQVGHAFVNLRSLAALNGTARIQITASTRTQLGTARIRTTAAYTLIGTSRVQQTVLQTQLGVSEVRIVSSHTQFGVGRIQITSLQNQTGISRVQVNSLQTQTGVARTQFTTVQTQLGVSRLYQITLQTQTGDFNIQVTAAQSQTGDYRIRVTSPLQQEGTSRIVVMSLQTQTGISRIGITTQQAQTGVTNIYTTTSKVQRGVVRVQRSSQVSQFGISNFVQRSVQSQFGASRFRQTTPVQQLGIASVHASTTQVQLGHSFFISIRSQQTQFGVSKFLPPPTVRTQHGKAYIQQPSTSLMWFTAAGKNGVSNGEGDMGVYNFKTALGFRRQSLTLRRKLFASDLQYDFIKFTLFRSQALDWTPIPNTVGFAVSGKTAAAGYGIIGRDLEKYATLGILTNVRETQANLEILANGNPHVWMTQVCHELLWTPLSRACISQVTKEIITIINLGIVNSVVTEGLFSGDNVRGGHAGTDSVCIELMSSIKAAALMTQATKEVLATGDPKVVMSQVNQEILVYNQLVSYSNILVPNVVIESLETHQGYAVITGLATEMIVAPIGKARISADTIEVIHNDDRNAVVDAVQLEEINNSTTMQGCVDSVAVEMLVRSTYDPMVAALVNNPHFHI